MFFSILSRSTQRAGVSSSHFEMPGLTVVPSVMLRISAAVYPLTGRGIQRNADAAPAAERNERREDREGLAGMCPPAWCGDGSRLGFEGADLAVASCPYRDTAASGRNKGPRTS